MMDDFGPWLPWLFDVSTVLLVGGLLATQLAAAADSSLVRGLGRGAINVGWRMMLAAAATTARSCGCSSAYSAAGCPACQG